MNTRTEEEDKISRYDAITFIEDEVYYDRAVVIPSRWSDFLSPEERHDTKMVHRGALRNCLDAIEIVPVWMGMGWTDCSVEWLREQKCPEELLKDKRPNDRVKKKD